ncbi:pickpocket 29 isoform X1 [Musca autumnalis]|uniref:pickpocket 29 isoform X1 n=1 Tax=Musca autumnalis TaxID=221902 RepID=UPI003CEEC038
MSDNICMRIFQKFYKWFRQESLYYRVFWAIIISISAWNILSIFVLTIKRYFSDSISIGIETTYLQWNNTFPAVSFCLTKNRSSGRVNDFVAAENIPHKVSRAIYVKNLHDYMFTNPNNFHFKEDYCDGLNSTCGVDILRLRREILPSSCQFFMANVSYLGKVVENCEDIFKFHQLEMGYCYLANNILDYKSFDNLPLKFDISNREKSLKVHLRGGFIWKYEMYVHSPDDLPYFNSITYDAFSDPTIYRFNVEEYDNNPDVKEEALQQRSCKFPNEKDPGSPWHYSFSTCMSYLRIKFELDQCNCTHFTSPEKYKPFYCDTKGLRCISDAQITAQVKEFVVSKNACYPSCVEQQITLVGTNQIQSLDVTDTLYIEISITNLPSVRYNRVVTQTYLDLVVSVGGVIGLFAGASALNFLEIVYVLLRKKV